MKRKFTGIFLGTLVVLSVDVLTTEAESNVFTIAHRGDSYYAPEHTIAAFDLGLSRKSEVIELDLQMTKDKQIVAFHDPTLDRTTNGTGNVKDKTLKELKRLDAGSWFNEKYPKRANPAYVNQKIPTLDEVLKRYKGKARIFIEMKTPEKNKGMEEAVYKVLKRNGMLNASSYNNRSIVIESFSPQGLKKLQKLAPGLPMTYSVWNKEYKKLTDQELRNIRKYADMISIDYRETTQAKVNRLKRFGFTVMPYTVDKERDMKRMMKYGIHGIYSNNPQLLNSLR